MHSVYQVKESDRLFLFHRHEHYGELYDRNRRASTHAPMLKPKGNTWKARGAIPVALLMHLVGIQCNNLIITDVFTPYWESLPGSDLISNLFQDIPNLIVLWTVFFPFLQFFFPVILFPKWFTWNYVVFDAGCNLNSDAELPQQIVN